jgi:hypothetical protein
MASQTEIKFYFFFLYKTQYIYICRFQFRQKQFQVTPDDSIVGQNIYILSFT